MINYAKRKRRNGGFKIETGTENRIENLKFAYQTKVMQFKN